MQIVQLISFTSLRCFSEFTSKTYMTYLAQHLFGSLQAHAEKHFLDRRHIENRVVVYCSSHVLNGGRAGFRRLQIRGPPRPEYCKAEPGSIGRHSSFFTDTNFSTVQLRCAPCVRVCFICTGHGGGRVPQ